MFRLSHFLDKNLPSKAILEGVAGLCFFAAIFTQSLWLGIASVVLFAGLLVRNFGGYIVPIENAIDIRLEPESMTPISGEQRVFRTDNFDPPNNPLPTVRGEWSSVSEDHALLARYAKYLDDTRSKIDEYTQTAIDRYTKDRSDVVNQQKQLLRHAFKARRIIARFNDLPMISSMSVEKLPKTKRIALPPAPNYTTPAELAKQLNTPPAHAINAATRLAQNWTGSSGDIFSLLATIVIAVAQQAVRAKKMVSEFLRILEDSRGKISIICERNKLTMEAIGIAHSELVEVSIGIGDAIVDMNSAIERAQHTPKTAKSISKLTESQRDAVLLLHWWIKTGEKMSSTNMA